MNADIEMTDRQVAREDTDAGLQTATIDLDERTTVLEETVHVLQRDPDRLALAITAVSGIDMILGVENFRSCCV